MRLYHEEQFGSVIPVVPFDDLNTPVSFVTDSPYGQQVSIFSEDSKSIAHLIDELNGEVGRININTQCQRGLIHLLSVEEKIRQKAPCLFKRPCWLFLQIRL